MKRDKAKGWAFRALLVGFAAFVAGGLYFGYVFVTTAVELLVLQDARPPTPAQGRQPIATIPSAATSVPSRPAPPAPPTDGRVNVLLLGLDERPVAHGQPSRSDTMIVASLDTRAQKATLLSIPRDLWVAIPDMDGGVIYHKVNTAHFWGQYWHYPDGKEGTDGGPELAKRTVEYNLGIPIHYYARIDFEGFEKAVDLIGGLEVDVPREIVDREYPLENDVGVTTVRFAAGPQHMDGMTALRYAQTRNPDSDFGRMARQRQVLLAFREQALRLDLLPKVPQLLAVMRDSFDTDLPLGEIVGLANLAWGIDGIGGNILALDAVGHRGRGYCRLCHRCDDGGRERAHRGRAVAQAGGDRPADPKGVLFGR
jgi:LCP family protein required for cell wall assembly